MSYSIAQLKTEASCLTTQSRGPPWKHGIQVNHPARQSLILDIRSMHQLSMNLNLAALLGRINRALEEASRFVSMAMSEVESTGTESQGTKKAFSINFNSGLNWSRDDARMAWTQWILKNGFRDIAELISVVLEEACQVLTLYTLLDRQTAGEKLSTTDFAGRDKDIARFHRLSLSDKLDWLLAQSSFSIPDEKLEEIMSINVARNCLGHRSGIVGERDITHNGMLVVMWLGMDTVVQTEGKEIPFEPPMYLENGGTMVTRLVRRTSEFHLGSRITFNEREFSEIAWTIFAFAQAVTSSLESSGKSRGLKFAQAEV